MFVFLLCPKHRKRTIKDWETQTTDMGTRDVRRRLISGTGGCPLVNQSAFILSALQVISSSF